MHRLLLTASILVIFSLGLSACNTMRGIGQDLQDGGHALEGSAQRNGAWSGSGPVPPSNSRSANNANPYGRNGTQDNYATESNH